MIEADFNNDGVDDVDESGLGDIDMRFLTVPVLDMANKQALAFGLELFLDTASEDALGAGTTSLGPQVFYVKFLKRGLFAPGLQYKFSVDEDDGRNETNQFIIDLEVGWMLSKWTDLKGPSISAQVLELVLTDRRTVPSNWATKWSVGDMRHRPLSAKQRWPSIFHIWSRAA